MLGIYNEMKAAGVPMGNHESDLHAMVTPESERIINEYPFKDAVTKFRSNIDKKLWFDIPFAYAPWWEKRIPVLSK